MSLLDQKLEIQFKPIEYVKPKSDTCSVCCQEFDTSSSIVECHQCHQHLHTDCQVNWIITKIFEGDAPTCPLCRSDWVNGESRLYPII